MKKTVPAKNKRTKSNSGLKLIKTDRFRHLLFALLAVTVAVIWFNSAMPVPVSKAQSNMTEQLIENVVPTEVPIFDYIVSHLRKSAHVIEYGLLEVFVFLMFVIFPKHRKKTEDKKNSLLSIQKLWNMLTVPLAVAVTDESIQILSGRGPLISDVLIDMLGAVCAMGICFLCWFAAKKIKRIKYPAPKLLEYH